MRARETVTRGAHTAQNGVQFAGPLRMKAKINGKVRNVSPAMARRLRAKGIRVEGDKALVAPPKPPTEKPEALPQAPEPNPVDVLTALMTQKLADVTTTAATIDLESFHEAADKLLARDDAFDLDELERLTAPTTKPEA